MVLICLVTSGSVELRDLGTCKRPIEKIIVKKGGTKAETFLVPPMGQVPKIMHPTFLTEQLGRCFINPPLYYKCCPLLNCTTPVYDARVLSNIWQVWSEVKHATMGWNAPLKQHRWHLNDCIGKHCKVQYVQFYLKTFKSVLKLSIEWEEVKVIVLQRY